MGNVFNVQRNPGTISDLHKECKDLMPYTFKGIILMLNNNLSNHFQLMHTISLFSLTKCGYRCGATYVSAKQFLPTIASGDIDIYGNLNTSIIHQFSEQFQCKFSSQIQPREIMTGKFTADYRGEDFTAAVTIGNPNIINNSGTLILHYLQSFSKRWSLGGELLYQFEPNLPSGRIRLSSLVAKYVHNTWTASGSLGLGGMHLCCSKKFSEELQLGIEVDANFHKIQQSTANIRAKLDIPGSDVVLRGMVDNNLNVSGVLEIWRSLAISGRCNFTEKLFMYGISIIFV